MSEKNNKFMFYLYWTTTVMSLIWGLISMTTIVWIAYFSFLIMSITITIFLIIKKEAKDIKDMIKILEEGDNYDK